jgi:hypothetical protein
MVNVPDHIKAAENAQTEIFRKMSPARKLELTQELINTARALKAAGFRMAHPDWNEDTVQKAVSKVWLHSSS